MLVERTDSHQTTGNLLLRAIELFERYFIDQAQVSVFVEHHDALVQVFDQGQKYLVKVVAIVLTANDLGYEDVGNVANVFGNFA